MVKVEPIEVPDIDPRTLIDKEIRSVYNEKLGFNVRYGVLNIVEVMDADAQPQGAMRMLWICWKMYNKAYPDLTYDEFLNIKRSTLEEITTTIIQSSDFREMLLVEELPSDPNIKILEPSVKPLDSP